MDWSSKMIFVAGQNQHARSLVVIVTRCFSLGTKKKRKRATEVTQLTPWHKRWSLQFLAWGMKFFIFPERFDWEPPGPLLSCCGGLSLSRWTKPNHGGVECWPMRCLRPRRIPTPEERRKRRQMKELSAWVDIRSQVPGTGFFFSPSLIGIVWIHFFFSPLKAKWED